MPRIEVGPLPHFSLSGSFNPRTGSVPSVGVNWYATGGIFDGASIIGVGERGPEAVVPLSNQRYIRPFAEQIAERVGGATVNQTFNTRVVRSNEDLYVAAAILNGAAMRQAGVVR